MQVWLEPARPSDPEQTRAELDQLAKYGGITVNELRAAYGFPEVEGGDLLIEPGHGADTMNKYVSSFDEERGVYRRALERWERRFDGAA